MIDHVTSGIKAGTNLGGGGHAVSSSRTSQDHTSTTRKEAIDGDGGIYVNLGFGRSEGIVARNSSEDGDWQRSWGRSNEDDAGEIAIKQVFKKEKLNEFNGEKKTGEDLEAWIEELEDFFDLQQIL